MKKIVVAALVGLALGSIGAANATSRNTIAIGYAQTQLSGLYSGSMPGVNVKYHWEDLDSGFGAIASISYTKADILNASGGTIEQGSFLVGPSYRINDYISPYLLLGFSKGAVDVPAEGDHQERTSFSFGGGVQVNVSQNWAVDLSYQYANFSSYSGDPDIKAGTWGVGVGYSF